MQSSNPVETRPDGGAPSHTAPRIVKNTLVLLGGQAAFMLSSAVTTFVLARFLGTSEFGEYNAVIAFVGLFMPIATFGLDTVLIREMAQNRQRAPAIYGAGLALRLLASVAAIVLCIGISAGFDYSARERQLILLWSLSLPFTAGQLFQAPFALALDNRRPVAVSSTVALIGALIRLTLIVAGVGLSVYLLVDLGLTLVTSLLLWRTSHIHSQIRPQWNVDWEIWKSLLWDCTPLLAAGVLVAAYHRMDQQFLLMWKGPGEVGNYAAAVRLAELLSLVPMFLMRSAFPVISAAAGSAGGPLEISRTCYRYVFLMTLPAVLAGVLLAPQVIGALYGSSYRDASVALPWLMLAEIPVVAGIVYGHFSIAARLQRFDALFTLISAATNLVLCVMLIPRSGLAGAAIASLVSYGISIPVQLVFRATRSYSLILLREALRTSVVGFLTWLAFVLAGRILPVTGCILVSAAVFFGTAMFARLLRKDDVELIRRLSR